MLQDTVIKFENQSPVHTTALRPYFRPFSATHAFKTMLPGVHVGRVQESPKEQVHAHKVTSRKAHSQPFGRHCKLSGETLGQFLTLTQPPNTHIVQGAAYHKASQRINNYDSTLICTHDRAQQSARQFRVPTTQRQVEHHPQLRTLTSIRHKPLFDKTK